MKVHIKAAMPVTIKQIALKSGLSIQTVSRILNNNAALYRKETRDKVLVAAEDLGYRPNSSALAMRRGSFGCVALLLSEESSRSLLPPLLLQSLHRRLAEHDLHLNVVTIGENDLADAARTPKILREAMVDGVLINYNAEIPERLTNWIERYNIPAVWINSKQPSDCIYPDDFGSARLATRRLIELGHRRIVFFQWMDSPHYSAVDRRVGYEAAMAEAGLAHRFVRGSGNMLAKGAYEQEYEWLLGNDRPTAAICYNSGSLTELMLAAMYLHVNVPGDLSMCAFNDGRFYLAGRTVNSIILPEEEIAATAVNMLVNRIEDRDLHCDPRSVMAVIDEGDTVSRLA